VTWNYVFALPVMRLFGHYMKVLLWLPQIDFFVHALNLYSLLLVQAQVADTGLVAVLEFMRSHEDPRVLDVELRPCTEFFASFFEGILPSLQVALGPGTTFPWKIVSLIDAPKVMLPSDLFFRPSHLVLVHLSDFCEWLLLFGLVCLHHFQSDQAFMDTLALVYSYVIVVHVCGEVNLDLRPFFLQFKKFKRLSDIDIPFLETAETQWGRQRISQGFRRQHLAVALHDLLSAIEMDEGLLCTRFGLALSLIGFASFEITNAFKLRQARPQWQPYEPRDLSELLYYFMRLNALVGNNFGKLQRFIVFNAHEYDANYLESLVLSFAIPSPIFLKVRALIQALRQIDIEEYDSGTVFDLSRCPLVIDSISVAFNAYGLARGITHIHPLLQLLAGISIRFRLYHEGLCGLLEFTKAETFWHYLDCLGDIVNKHGDANARFNAIVLLCYHFMGLDLPAISEVDGLKDQIQKHYDSSLQCVSQTVIMWYKVVLDAFMDGWQPMTGPDAFQAQRLKSLPANKTIQKATFTLQTVHAIGMIRVVDTDHNVAEETIVRVEQMMKFALVRDKTERGPLELEKRFQIGKWAFQQICSAANLAYQRTVMRNTSALASEASQGLPRWPCTIGPCTARLRKCSCLTCSLVTRRRCSSGNQASSRRLDLPHPT
jgi:hypothetical protein